MPWSSGADENWPWNEEGSKARCSASIFSFESGSCLLIAVAVGCVAATARSERTSNRAGGSIVLSEVVCG